jgi:hypothetical protein
VSLLQATDAYDGRAVLPSRDDLSATLAPPELLAAEAARQALAAAVQRAADGAAAEGLLGVRRARLADFRQALVQADDPRSRLDADLAADLAVALADVVVRDEVLTWALREAGPLEQVLRDLAARTVAPYDVPVCTLLAIVAWLRGDGGLANVALERAWRADPTYSLAALVREGLSQQVPPDAVRDWLRSTERAMRPRRPARRRAR